MKYILSTMLALVLVVTGAAPSVIHAQSAASTGASLPPLVLDTSSCIYINSNASIGMRDRTSNGNVVNLQAFLHKYKFLTVEPTGYFGQLTLNAVKAFQAQYNLPQTGFFGPLSRAQMKAVSCGDTNPSTKDVTISVTTDKKQYAATDIIAITVTASNLTNHDVTLNFTSSCQTNYLVGEYNDIAAKLCAQALTSITIPALGSKSWTMNHELTATPFTAGTYKVKGEVIGYGSATTDISISNEKVASVTVVSPNGGESFKLGSTQMITWNSYFPYPTFAAVGHTINALRKYECGGPICPAIAYAPVKIAENITGGSYSWMVGKAADGSTLQPGTYSIEVCMSGGSTCDISNSTFTITQ